MSLSGFDKQIDSEGHTLADLVCNQLVEIVEVLAEIREELREIRRLEAKK